MNSAPCRSYYLETTYLLTPVSGQLQYVIIKEEAATFYKPTDKNILLPPGSHYIFKSTEGSKLLFAALNLCLSALQQHWLADPINVRLLQLK